MCGIVGYVGHRPAADILIKGLRRLEYRGYDSAGIALFDKGKLKITKSQGKLENVERLLLKHKGEVARANAGIGHTRWATHGRPNTTNAHPHRMDHVAIVHNGIIENYQDIKRDLIKMGYQPVSETDSELFAFMVYDEMEKGLDLVSATRTSFLKLHGGCSVVVMSEREPDLVVGVRNGSPLVATVDPQGGAILASDAQPILEYAKEVVFLENGDMVVGTKKGIRFIDVKTGKAIKRKATALDWSADKIDKQGFEHYMLKEIHEQPSSLVDTLNSLVDRTKKVPFALNLEAGAKILKNAKELTIVACGTSWHAALVGKYWIERMTGVPVNVELASEFRYRDPVLRKGTVIVGISQSGETADTLAVIRDVKERGFKTVAILNVRNSTISREADATFYTAAGPEIGVAATKTFTSQMLTLLTLAGYMAGRNENGVEIPGMNAKTLSKQSKELFAAVEQLPHVMGEYLTVGKKGLVAEVKKVSKSVQDAKGFFFIGRGLSFPIALEGALKLKEIAYVHAEGYAAGELKHGPIAMIDKDMVAVVLAPKDKWREKTVSNLEEVKARGARIIGIGAADDASMKKVCDYYISLPEVCSGEGMISETIVPFYLTAAVQLLSYELAVLKGTDLDKPRNLAKSVTVE